MSAQRQEREKASSTAPQTSEGGFRGFLKRLFAEPAVAQPTPITPKIVQPPPGLDDFAAGLHQVITVHTQRELDLDNEREIAVRITTEAREIAKAIQRELEDQEVARQEQSKREGSEILEDFQVAERLRVIQQAAWGGRGKIRIVGAEFGIRADYGMHLDSLDRLAGFELIHQLPSYCCIKDNFSRGWHREMLVPGIQSTTLAISVLNLRDISGEVKRVLKISSPGEHLEFWMGQWDRRRHATPGYKVWESYSVLEGWEVAHWEVVVPIGTEDDNVLLDKALTQETIFRSSNGLLPEELEKKAILKLAEVRQGSNWRRWTNVFDYSDSE